MDSVVHFGLVILPVLYTLLVMAYARIFLARVRGLARIAWLLLVTTVGVHFLTILLRGFEAGACPLGVRADFLALMAFSIGIIYLILEARIGERSTGVFALTPAFLLQLIASVGILGTPNPVGVDLGVGASLQAFSTFVGFSAVALSSVYGVLYLCLYTAIKRGRFGLFYRGMPALETLSDLNYVATWIAFLALTLGVGLGLWPRVGLDPDRTSLMNAELVLVALVWILYGSCILARRFYRLGGKRLAYSTLLGLGLVIGALIGGSFGGRVIG